MKIGNIGKKTEISFPAHVRKSDGIEQCVHDHCANTASVSSENAVSISLCNSAYLIGLLHDLGKSCPSFRDYLRSATGFIDQDSENYVDAVLAKGKIDHSTAGAQWIWKFAKLHGRNAPIAGQALALCLASHHSGLIDCLSPEGKDVFTQRMNKSESETHLNQAIANRPEIITRAETVAPLALKELYNRFLAIRKTRQSPGAPSLADFDCGLLVRFLFSCLIDADRFDSAAFENAAIARLRNDNGPDWGLLIERLEAKLGEHDLSKPINRLRRNISDCCRQRADDERGIFSLTVPTGGGKTYAALRFALHHARRHGLRRIINVIPYTSIIDQNAAAARNVLEAPDDSNPFVLEHHSNLEPERDTWISKHLGESWDAPVIYTTMVQFLEAMFGGGTRGVRRLHRLSGAVIVFDEAQTLPIRCVHLFCNAINFLVRECGASVVLSTATQPLLSAVNPMKGRIDAPREMMESLDDLFQALERVNLTDHTAAGNRAMTLAEIAALAQEEARATGNCLIVVNTKKAAKDLYSALKPEIPDGVFHLSTDMCAQHRIETLAVIKARLKNKTPTLCISTQLIEAGVDIDFRTVIRFLAGLDSIAQAAGRCNREGTLKRGRVHIVRPDQENLSRLPDIKKGQEATSRVLRDYAADPASLGGSLLHPKALERYFVYAFHERRKEMDYPADPALAGRDNTLLLMLSRNDLNVGNLPNGLILRQSFKTAAEAFQAIEAPTEGVIVPHGDGQAIITGLHDELWPDERRALLRRAQRFSVNIYPHLKAALQNKEAIYAIPGTNILALKDEYYSAEFGLSDDLIGDKPFYCY